MEATSRTHRRARDRKRRRLEHWAIAGRPMPGPVGRLILVTPGLAPYLRRGLLKEMGAAATALAELAAWDDFGDRREYESALWTIEAARKVLAKIGDCAPEAARAIALSRDDHPYLVYRALRSQLETAGVPPGERAAADRGPHAEASTELATALGALRGEIAHSPAARREARLNGSLGSERILASRVNSRRG